jgi:hypothetical protein
MDKQNVFTAVYRDITPDEAGEITCHPKWSAGSWSHALDSRNEAVVALEAANARLAALESERDALLAAAGKEAVGQAGAMPGTDGFTMACFKASDVPIGTPLYTAPTAALENGGGRDAWQPIDTAPKFGEPIDVWGRYGRKSECVFGKPTYAGGLHWIYEAGYDSNGPVFEIVVDPTHWMPPPAAPAAANDKEKQS